MTKLLLLVACLGIACQNIRGAVVRENSSRKNLTNTLNVIYEWKHIDYDFGSDERRQTAIESGEYDRTKNYPSDVDQWHDKTFVTMLRYNGVPSSLNVVSDKTGNGGPLLQPYPDWSFAKYEDCSGIVSAHKIAIDEYERLWVLDSGLVNDQSMCSPKLLAFNLNTSQLLKQVEIPHNVAVNTITGKGRLVSLTVQAMDSVNTTVYMADNGDDALIVYQNADDSFHRLSSHNHNSRSDKISQENLTLQEVDNRVSGMALSPVTNNLYYSHLSSQNLYYVNTESLMNSQNQGNDVQYERVQDIFNSQLSVKAVSKNGVLLFGFANNTLGCWNEHQSLDRQNIDVVAQNETLQMIVSMKVKQNPPQSGRINNTQRNEYLLVLSNRMQNMLNNNLNLEHMNFRILGTNVNDLIRNSRCANSDNQDNNQHNRNHNQARHSSKSDNQDNNHNNNQAHHSSKSDNQNNNQYNN
ncbi:major royal jelly protein 4-like [Apis laboriosa]|uniref:major royal jelly protein 4-like n=1 Tax=Apis laboriosa TaxID=183418 RepID=UPI001CC72DE7|nr:major royal jelly protein 4-like [Apis laboriosa]